MTKGEILGEACCCRCGLEVLVAKDGVRFDVRERWELRLPALTDGGWNVGVPLGDGVKILQRTMVWPEHVCPI